MMNNYVYQHIDPFTGHIVYVGHGTGHRAWVYTKRLRDQEHTNFLKDLERKGFTPNDWVIIVDKNLSKETACELERTLIKFYKPIFNKIQGASLLKVTPKILQEAFELREKGWSFSKIAENFDLATMTIHRAMNGKSPALEEIIERS